jgi:2'-5' RNA ligase
VALALELTLDQDGDARVRALWDALEGMGIGTLATMLGGRVDPHVSLIVADDTEAVVALGGELGEIVRMAGPQTLPLDAVGLFPGPGPVIYLGVTPTESLVRLHAQTAEFLRERGVDVWPQYRPGVWVPHCTVAMSVPDERLVAAATALRAALPIRARAARVGLVDSETGETTLL